MQGVKGVWRRGKGFWRVGRQARNNHKNTRQPTNCTQIVSQNEKPTQMPRKCADSSRML